MIDYTDNIVTPKIMSSIERQRQIDNENINILNNNRTYLSTIAQQNLFLQYVVERIDLYGCDEYYENYHKQLFNLYLKEVSKEFLKNKYSQWVQKKYPEWYI